MPAGLATEAFQAMAQAISDFAGALAQEATAPA